MNILIAGGAGFIGSNLTNFHLKRKDTVFVIDNFITGSIENIKPFFKQNSFHFIQEDIVNYNFTKLPTFDIIYHLASPASPIQYKKYPIETLLANSQGTFKLLEFFKKSKSRSFVLASTSEVYGDPMVHPQLENYWGNVNPVGIRSCYDEGKRFAEALTMAYFRKFKLNIRIARIFNTYGPYMEQNDGRVISNFIIQALTKKPITIYGDGKQTRSFCYVSDMVRGLYLLASTEKIAGEIINLGNPNEKTISQISILIKEMVETKAKIIFQSIDSDDPKKRKPNISKAIQMLKWKPDVSLNTGLQKTINYFSKELA